MTIFFIKIIIQFKLNYDYRFLFFYFYFIKLLMRINLIEPIIDSLNFRLLVTYSKISRW